MAKHIKQFIFYQENSEKNYPEGIMSIMNLTEGKVFANYMPISQLSIQSLPGTKIYLNNSHDPIVIGYTGIYEIAINNLAEITSLKIDYDSLRQINSNKETILLIDIVYDKEEA